MPELQIADTIDESIIEKLKTMEGTKFFIVTGPHVSGTESFKKLAGAMEEAGKSVCIYNETKADPTISQVDEMIGKAHDFKADLVIGIGGGSPLDASKLVAALADSGESCRNYLEINSLTSRKTPLLVIPTTSGTGTEVTKVSIVTDENDNVKKGIVSPCLIPDYAFLITEMTVTMPPGITATTGVDALCHAAEAYTATVRNPYSDIMALEAVKLVSENLLNAYRNPGDLTARANMLRASLLAGIAFGNSSTTAVHAFAYPLGGMHHTPHGLANSLFLIPVFRNNMKVSGERIGHLAAAMGYGDTAEDFVRGADELRRSLDLPLTLKEIGIPESDIAVMAEKVMGVTRLLSVNPVEITPEDALRIYTEAYGS